MLLAPYDAIFFKEPHIVDRLRSVLDLPVYYLPQACNPRWHRPLVPAGPSLILSSRAVCTRAASGSWNASRLRAFRSGSTAAASPVARRDTLVKFHTGRHVFREDKARAFRSAAAPQYDAPGRDIRSEFKAF